MYTCLNNICSKQYCPAVLRTDWGVIMKDFYPQEADNHIVEKSESIDKQIETLLFEHFGHIIGFVHLFLFWHFNFTSSPSHILILSPLQFFTLIFLWISLPPFSITSYYTSNFLPLLTLPPFFPLSRLPDCWSRQASTSTDRPKLALPCMKLPCVERPRQWDSCWR